VTTALQYVDESLETNATNNKARVFKAICLRRLGRKEEAVAVLAELLKIDYFATSLPNLLVFDEHLDEAKRARMKVLLSIAQGADNLNK